MPPPPLGPRAHGAAGASGPRGGGGGISSAKQAIVEDGRAAEQLRDHRKPAAHRVERSVAKPNKATAQRFSSTHNPA